MCNRFSLRLNINPPTAIRHLKQLIWPSFDLILIHLLQFQHGVLPKMSSDYMQWHSNVPSMPLMLNAQAPCNWAMCNPFITLAFFNHGNKSPWRHIMCCTCSVLRCVLRNTARSLYPSQRTMATLIIHFSRVFFNRKNLGHPSLEEVGFWRS